MGGKRGARGGRGRAKTHVRGFYAIIDTALVPLEKINEVTEKLLSTGVKVLQLRAKGLASGEFLLIARKIKRLCVKNKTLFIVNDRADIALASCADGLHIGQSDIPVQGARALLGEQFIIGLSTHSLAELERAGDTSADYISFGPIFSTTTKKNAEPTLGLDALKEASTLVVKPLVAIGGISEENLPQVLNCGADAVAVISHVLCSKNPGEKAAALISICSN